MAYAQIAQQTWTVPREDGTTRDIRLTFKEKDGSAASLTVPLVQDIKVIHGNSSDDPDKPIKVSQCIIQLKDEQSAGTLIDKLDNAAYRQIYIKCEDVTNSYVLFEGYVEGDQTKFGLYKDVQSIKVKATGHLSNLSATDAADALKTLYELSSDIDSSLDISRALDVYTSMLHDGKAVADPLPNYLRGNQKLMAGNGDEADLLTAVKSMANAFGFQVFQRNGRLVFAELYERGINGSAANKYEGDGAGNFTQTTEDLRVTLDRDDVIKNGEYENTYPIAKSTRQFNLITRTDFTFPIVNDAFITTWGNSTSYGASLGLVRSGDIIKTKLYGFIYPADPHNDVSYTAQPIEFKLINKGGGADLWYDFANDQWVETQTYLEKTLTFLSSNSQDAQWGQDKYLTLSEVPDGFIGEVQVTHHFDGKDFTQGSSSDLDQSEAQEISLSMADDDEGAVELYHQFNGLSSFQVGDNPVRSYFLADEDQYSDKQSYEYDTGTSWQNTNLWIDSGGNDDMMTVTARRVGKVVAGSGQKFDVRRRDFERLDLLTVFQIEDQGGTLQTCLPLEVQHDVLEGFYRVRLIKVMDQLSSENDLYSTEPASSGGDVTTNLSSGDSTGGGGVAGKLDDLADVSITNVQTDDMLIFDGENFINKNPSGIKSTLGLVVGTDVQAQSSVLQNLADNLVTTATQINALDGSQVETAQLQQVANIGSVTISNTQWGVLGSLTSNAGELNILDGATLSTAELNILDGVTATTSEINVLSGGIDLNEINNVNITDPPVAGQVLYYGGSAWVNSTQPFYDYFELYNSAEDGAGEGGYIGSENRLAINGTTTINIIKSGATDGSIGDVTLSIGLAAQSATSGQVLKWTGSTWAPATDENTYVTSFTHDTLNNQLDLGLSNGDTVSLDLGTSLDDRYVTQANQFTQWYASDAAGQQDITIGDSDELVFTAGTGLTNLVSGSTITYNFDGASVAGTNLSWDGSSLNSSDTTYTAGNGLTLSGTEFNFDSSYSPTFAGGTFNGEVYLRSGYRPILEFIDTNGGVDNYRAQCYFDGPSSEYRFWARNADDTGYTQATLVVYNGSSYDTVWHGGNLTVTPSYLESINQNLGSSDSPTFAGGTFNSDVSITGTSGSQLTLIRSTNTSQGVEIGGGGAVAEYVSYVDDSSFWGRHRFYSRNSSGTNELDFDIDRNVPNVICYLPFVADDGIDITGAGSQAYALDVTGDINLSGISYASNHSEGSSDPRLKSNYEVLDPLSIASHAVVRSYDKEGREGREIGLRTDEMKQGHPLLVGSMKHKEYGTVETLSAYSVASVALAGVGALDEKVESNSEKIKRLQEENKNLKQEIEYLKAG